MTDEEAQLQAILEQSKREAEEQEKLRQKNDELLKVMKDIEQKRPEGWGLDKKVEKTGEEFTDLQHNLNKAIKKLELEDKVNKYRKDDAEEILKDTNDGEDIEDRFKKLMNYKQKMIAAANQEREDQLRTTFHKIAKDEDTAVNMLQRQKTVQLEDLEAKKEQRRAKRGESKLGAMIEDNYEGFKNEEPEPQRPSAAKVLDDDFMADLKLVDVPDSDDECYF